MSGTDESHLMAFLKQISFKFQSPACHTMHSILMQKHSASFHKTYGGAVVGLPTICVTAVPDWPEWLVPQLSCFTHGESCPASNYTGCSVDHTLSVEVAVKSYISPHCWELNCPALPGFEELLNLINMIICFLPQHLKNGDEKKKVSCPCPCHKGI
jgi:hypothetical protein